MTFNEQRQIEKAKRLLESQGYRVNKKLNEDRYYWSSKYEPNSYALDQFLRKSGYYLADIKYADTDDLDSSDLVLSIRPKEESYMTPQIIHKDGEFHIITKSYGELIVSDLEMIVRGYENAIGVVHYLNSIPLEDLEISED